VATFWTEPWVLSQFYLTCIHHEAEPLIKSSFRKSSKMQSQCPQQALFKVITMDSQYSPILTQTLKEIIEYVARYIVIALWSTFWENSWWVAQPHGGYVLHEIVKELRGSVQKVATGCLGDYFQKVIVRAGTLYAQGHSTPCIFGPSIRIRHQMGRESSDTTLLGDSNRQVSLAWSVDSNHWMLNKRRFPNRQSCILRKAGSHSRGKSREGSKRS